MVLLFITTPYIVKKLGTEPYGLMNVLMAFTGYFSLIDLGFSNAITKYVAEYHAKGNSNRVSSIIRIGFFFYIIVAIIGSLLIFLGFQFYMRTFEVSEDLQSNLHVLIRLISFMFLFSILLMFFGGVLRGFQRFDYLAIQTIGLVTLDRLAIVLFLYLGHGLVSVISVSLVINMLGVVIFYLLLSRKFIVLFPAWERSTFSLIFHFSKWKFLGSVAVNFLKHLPKMIIASLIGGSQVTFFVIPQMLAQRAGRTFCRTIDKVIYPFMSESVSIDTKENQVEMYFRSVKWLFSIMAPGTIYLLIFGDKVLTFWINTEMSINGTFILKTFAALYWFTCITWLGGSIYEAHGNTRFPNMCQLLILIVAIGLYFVFIPLWGINGIAAAHIVVVSIAIFFQHRVLQLLNTGWKRLIQICLLRPFLASVLTAAIIYPLRFLANNLFYLITFVPIVALIHCAMYYIIKVPDHTDYEIIRSFFRRNKKVI